MELRHLRYFVHVAEEQHYGRAAERLRVAQPALSRQIQDLEEEIGFKLFDRLPRGVKISAAGKSFLVDARRILHEVNEAAARAKRVAFVSSATRWRCPESVALLPVTDLKLPLPFALIWRKDNVSPLLEKFVTDVRQLPEVKAFANR